MSKPFIEIPDFSDEEKRIAEEVLTELVVLAMNVRPALRDYISNLCDGIADALDDDAVARSKQYALLRIRQSKDLDDE